MQVRTPLCNLLRFVRMRAKVAASRLRAHHRRPRRRADGDAAACLRGRYDQRLHDRGTQRSRRRGNRVAQFGGGGAR